MSFMQRWAEGAFGQVDVKPNSAYQAPTIEVYRQRFAAAASLAVTQIRAGKTNEKMGWCARAARGYVVTLRLGIKPLDCGDGRSQTIVPDVDAAVAFIEAAAQAALGGELDDALRRAQIKRAKPKTPPAAGA